MTAAQTSPHSIPLTADAVRAQWQDLGTPAAFRYFEGSRWTVDRRADLSSSKDIEVYVVGIQELDGPSSGKSWLMSFG